MSAPLDWRLRKRALLSLEERAVAADSGQVAAVNLVVTLRAIGVQGRTMAGNLAQMYMVGPIMPRMAAQAQEGWLLLQQLLGHRPVRIVTDHAILGHRRMLIHEGSLLR